MNSIPFSIPDMPISKLMQTIAVLLVSMMGAAVTTLMPLLVGAYSDSGLFTNTQVGLLTSAEVAGILIASTTAYLWTRKVNWKITTLLGLTVFVAANWLSLSVNQFESLFFIRLLAGIACGATYAISIAALGDFPKSDSAFSGLVTIQVVFGTIGFWLLPEMIGQQGLNAIFMFFNYCLIPALILSLFVYPENSKPQSTVSFRIEGSVKAASFIFMGVVAYYFAQGTVWAYLERIGADAGLTLQEIGSILGIGFGISAAGSLLSGLYVNKYGRHSGLYLTVLLQLPCLFALYFMSGDNVFWSYAFTTIIYQIMWSFIIPIMMGIFNDIDKSGKLIVLCVAAFKVGLVLGPPAAAWVVTISHVSNVIWLGALSIILSIWLCKLAIAEYKNNEKITKA